MEWLTDGTLIFRIDGNELSRTGATTNRAFHIPHFILINQAIGASGGTPDGSTNSIIISLKPEFRINPLLLIDSKSKKEVSKMGFDKSVHTFISVYNKKK